MNDEVKTPASALTGVELCERVALGMGWKLFWEYGDTKKTIAEGGFRPDLDGNHLAEVKAECRRRGWIYGSSVDPKRRAIGWVDTRDSPLHHEVSEIDSEALAFLRAFVAAVEAEKAT